nr:hypothetical protein L203_00348 [Cryptococcus depauperatus CBS 7841]
MLYLLQEYDQSSCQQNKPSKEKKGSNDDKKIVQEVAEQRTFHAQLQVPCIRSCVLPAAHPTVCSTSSTHFLTAKHDVHIWLSFLAFAPRRWRTAQLMASAGTTLPEACKTVFTAVPKEGRKRKKKSFEKTGSRTK